MRFALRASIFANVLLSVAGAYAAVSSRSLAVFAALLDTLLDLVSQVRWLQRWVLVAVNGLTG